MTAPVIRPHYHHAPFCQREDGSFVYRACCCSGKWLDIPTSKPLRKDHLPYLSDKEAHSSTDPRRPGW